MATFKEAFDYAKNNPDSDFAKQFGIEVSTGKHDQEAQQFGIDTTVIKQKFQPIAKAQEVSKKQAELKQEQANRPLGQKITEGIAGFTGGKVLAQGLGQVIANPAIARQQEKLLNDSVTQQTELLKKRKEIKDAGGDTTGIDRAIQINTENTNKIAEETGMLLNQKEITGKQLAGDVLQLGTTIAGAGTLPSASKAVTGSKTFVEGAKAGAKLGAKTGAIYGASSGVSEGLKEDGDALDIAQKGITGGLIGAGTGAVLGGLTGGITGKVKGAGKAKIQKQKSFVEDLVSPKLTSEYKVLAQKQGRVTDAGLLSGSKIEPSKRDLQLAEVVKDIVSPKLTPQANINKISQEVDNINTGVKAYVELNKSPFNTKQLSKQLNNGKDELNLIFASDKQAEKTYNAVVKEFMKHVESKDTAGLFKARQEFDKIPAIKKLLDSQGLGENAKREIVFTVRDMANKYTASLLPQGNKFRESLLNESKMIEALTNIAEKNADKVGLSNLQILVRKYPWIKTLGYATGIGSVGAVGAAVGAGKE